MAGRWTAAAEPVAGAICLLGSELAGARGPVLQLAPWRREFRSSTAQRILRVTSPWRVGLRSSSLDIGERLCRRTSVASCRRLRFRAEGPAASASRDSRRSCRRCYCRRRRFRRRAARGGTGRRSGRSPLPGVAGQQDGNAVRRGRPARLRETLLVAGDGHAALSGGQGCLSLSPKHLPIAGDGEGAPRQGGGGADGDGQHGSGKAAAFRRYPSPCIT